MNNNAVSPYATIAIGGVDHALDCSIGTLRNLQNHFKKDVILVQEMCFSMTFDELAKLFSLGMNDAPELESIATAIVDEIGIIHARAIAASWLAVAITPVNQREKKAQELKKALKKIEQK